MQQKVFYQQDRTDNQNKQDEQYGSGVSIPLIERNLSRHP